MRNLTTTCAAAALCMALTAASSAADDTPSFGMKGDAPPTGSRIRSNHTTGLRVPPDKRYDQLTPEQQLLLKSDYEHMGDGDEPPYPLYGMAPVYRDIHKVAQSWHVEGDFQMIATIDASGKAVSVDVYKSDDNQVARAIAGVLMLAKYKPALCGGVPCRQQFPFAMSFTIDHSLH